MQLVPLRDCPVEELNPLFAEETVHWNDHIFWDYHPTLDILKRFMRARTLPGFILGNPDRVMGYSYFVVDRTVAFIGNIYVRNDSACPQTYGALIERTVGAATSVPTVQRIETQIFEFNCELDSLFSGCGFRVLPRHFLVCPLAECSVQAPPQFKGGTWRFRRWQDKDLLPAAELVFDSYRNSFDASLCHDYQSRQGCVRFLKNLIDSPACGRFCPEDTLIAVDHFDHVSAVLLATRTQPTTAMIPQFSVRRQYQGRGLGRAMLATFLSQCRSQGLERITLSVSEANDRAFRLYLRTGFQIQKSFSAFIWERR
jgi:ribosomal protein S18 acetylase RimI-like enzyme